MKYIFTILFLMVFSALQAQNATLVWAKQLGSSFNEQGRSVAVDAAGNVHTVGNFFATGDFNPDPAVVNNLSTNGSGNDAFVSKLNASGSYVWAKQLGGSSPDEGSAVAVDVTGNVYSAGTFSGTADFNPDPAATFNLTASGTDVFISKLDASGSFVWAKQFTAASGATVSSIKVDALGNVHATGSFSGTVDFNPDAAVTNNLISAGSSDIFIVKLDAAGNFVWAKRIGGTSNDVGNSIAVDALSNVFTTGYFGGTVDFDPDAAATSNLVAGGTSDAFVSKLDASGNFVWAKKLGGTSLDIGYGIALDVTGNVYTTGTFAGTADLNPDAVATANFTSAGFGDIYVSKLDASGNYVWAKQLGGTSVDEVYSIAVSTSGVYTTGRFYTTADYNPDPAVTNNLTSFGADDIFVSKLDASGNFVWVKQIGGTGSDYAASMTVDASDNIYITGYFTGTSDFDPDPAVAANLVAGGGSTDAFIVKLSQSNALPFYFSSVKAYQANAGVQVEWKLATEASISLYEVEKSLDGINFTKAGSLIPTANYSSFKNYGWIDVAPFDGNNFYRLKAIETSGGFRYSSVVSINIKQGRSSISINPNPITDKIIHLQLQNQPKGIYSVRLFNNAGQLLYSDNISHAGGSSAQTIQLSSRIAAGNYHLQISNGSVQEMLRVIL